MRSLPLACRRRVAPLMAQMPPLGGGEVAVRGGAAPTSQTTSVKNNENGGLRLRRCACWAQRCPAWHVARTPRRTADLNLSTHTGPHVRPRSHNETTTVNVHRRPPASRQVTTQPTGLSCKPHVRGLCTPLAPSDGRDACGARPLGRAPQAIR
jgi:hypothetical protein